MPADRVLATQQARDAAQQMRALTGPVKEQVGRVLQHGRVLADPTQWDGDLAVRWRNGWGSDANQLKQTAARLDELERRAHEVVEDIFKADSGPASGEAGGPGLPELETYDRFDKTLAFIHREMIVNVQADFIKKLAAERKQIWWKGGLAALPGTLWIPGKIIAGKAAIDVGKATKEFYDHVKTDGPWDHKPRLWKDLRLDEKDRHFPIRGNEKYELFYDLWSNIHFGYVGKAAGFPRDVLQAGSVNEPGAGQNDQADVISVDIGVELWQKHGPDLKPEDIHRAILDHIDDYERAMKENPELLFLKPRDNGR